MLAGGLSDMITPAEAGSGSFLRGVVNKLSGAEKYPGAVSTRFPDAARRTEDPLATYLQPNMAALRADPKNYEKVLRIMADYPGMPAGLSASADLPAVEQQISDFMKGNLRSIYQAQPDVARGLGSKWYEGANRIAREKAGEFDLSTPSTAAVYAALSPQKDWFMNVSLGDRVLDIMANQQRKVADSEMLKTGRNLVNAKGVRILEDADLNALKGRQLRSLSPEDQATFVRLFDETYNPRGYDVIGPTGERLGPKLTKEGAPGGVAWGTFDQIENAIKAIRSGGDVNQISSDILGGRHKVRSFYNNILYPNATLGDVTSDTHNVAASLFRPLSGNSPEVTHNLASGGAKGAINMPSSAITGVQGSYPMFVDPMQQVAAEFGVLPRSAQSVTWEGIRGLFPPEFKRSSQADQIEQIWREQGIKNADEARRQIVNLRGGYRPPEWVPFYQEAPR